MPKKLTLFLVLCLVPVATWAQKRTLSLDEAVAAGLQASPGLHASQERVDASAAKAREIAADRLPSLKFGGGYTRLSEVPPFEVTLPIFPSPIVVSQNYFNNYAFRLGLQQPLFTGFRLEASTASARFLEKSAGSDLEKDRAEFIFAVKSGYWGLARAREIEKAVVENARQVAEHLGDVRAFFSQGLLTRNEVLRVELQLSNAELMEIDARNAVEVAQASLNNLIGWPLTTELELTTSADSLILAFPAEGKPAEDASQAQSLVESALSSRPELKAAEFRIRAAEAGVKAAKSGWYPQVFLSGGYDYLNPNPRLMPARDEFYGTWDIGISLSFDIWNWGQTKSQTSQAEAQLAEAKDTRKLLSDQAVLEVTQSRLDLGQARQKTVVAGQAVAQAEENLRITRESFKQGVALNTDVLDAEVAFLQAKINRTQAAIDLVLAEARLEKALGR